MGTTVKTEVTEEELCQIVARILNQLGIQEPYSKIRQKVIDVKNFMDYEESLSNNLAAQEELLQDKYAVQPDDQNIMLIDSVFDMVNMINQTNIGNLPIKTK